MKPSSHKGYKGLIGPPYSTRRKLCFLQFMQGIISPKCQIPNINSTIARVFKSKTEYSKKIAENINKLSG